MQYVILLIQLAVVAAMLFGLWKVFEKCGRKGWEGIVPIYNVYTLTQIVGRPVIWTVLCLIPLAGLYWWVLMNLDLAKSFGKSRNFGLGMGLLPFVFYPMLAMGNETYAGPTATGQTGFGLPAGVAAKA